MARITQTLTGTTGAVSWEIYRADEFNVPRIDLTFSAAPSSAGYLYVKKDAGAGAAYDSIIRVFNPVGYESISIEGMHGLSRGDKLVIEYANPDGVTVTGSATVDVPLNYGDSHLSGMTIANGSVRSLDSSHRRYYHVPVSSSNPGASGATWVDPSATRLRGWQLNAPTENLTLDTDIHADWDSSTNPDFEFTFTVNVDNTGGTANDVVNYQIILYYGQPDETALRTQTLTGSYTVGACAQYARFKHEVEIPRAPASNEILQGDVLNAVLSCLGTGDVTDITVNDASFYYHTTHIGIEAGDV